MHVDAVRRERDERTGRDRPLVDEGDRSDIRADDRVADGDGGVEPAAERVDLVDDEIESAVQGLARAPFDERSETELDLAFDRDDEHATGRGDDGDGRGEQERRDEAATE